MKRLLLILLTGLIATSCSVRTKYLIITESRECTNEQYFRMAQRATECVMSNDEFIMMAWSAYEEMKDEVNINVGANAKDIMSVFIKMVYLDERTEYSDDSFEEKAEEKLGNMERIVEKCFDEADRTEQCNAKTSYHTVKYRSEPYTNRNESYIKCSDAMSDTHKKECRK